MSETIETVDEKRKRLLAELDDLDRPKPLPVDPPAPVGGEPIHPILPPFGGPPASPIGGVAEPLSDKPKAIPDDALTQHFEGASLGTWLLRLKAIFEAGYSHLPVAGTVEHKPAE